MAHEVGPIGTLVAPARLGGRGHKGGWLTAGRWTPALMSVAQGASARRLPRHECAHMCLARL